jgi:hypothetical protein
MRFRSCKKLAENLHEFEPVLNEKYSKFRQLAKFLLEFKFLTVFAISIWQVG